MEAGYEIIENKINDFIKKYYINKIIKGFIVYAISLLFIYFTLVFLENYIYLSILEKNIILYFLVLYTFIFLIYFLIIPFLKYFNIIRTISNKYINTILIQQFPDIKDQLINIIELKNEAKISDYSKELLLASIIQKTENLKFINFSKAIKLSKIIKLSYLFIFLLIISVLFFFLFNNEIKNSSYRLFNFNKEFVKPSPYNFIILNDNFNIATGQDFTFKLKVDSKIEFNDVNIQIGNNTFKMNKDSLNFYSYKLNSINNNINFKYLIKNYHSISYELKIFQKPIISNFNIEVVNPSYSNLPVNNFKNLTDLKVLRGSKCFISFETFKTDSLLIRNENKLFRIKSEDRFYQTIDTSSIIFISIKNENFLLNDFLAIKFSVINDDYPLINVSQIVDSIDYNLVYFKGNISDDYGFNYLKFIVIDNNSIYESELDFISYLNNQDFYYAFDFKTLKTLSNNVKYYFEVSDNDNIGGFKKTKSQFFEFELPNLKDIEDFQDDKYEKINELINDSKVLSEEIQKDILNFNEKLINSELTDWDKNNFNNSINRKKSSLENLVKQIEKNTSDLNNYLKSFSEQNEDILDKQKNIEDLLKDVFSDELKSLLDQFNKMLSENNKDNMNDFNEKVELSLEDLKKQLDKNLELLKRFQIEQKLDLLINEVNRIHKNQQSDILKFTKDNFNEILKDQEIFKNDFNNIETSYKELEDLNDQLDKKIDLTDLKNDFNKIDYEFDKTIQNLQKGKKKETSESLNKNNSNFENLSFALNQIKDKAFKEQKSENIDDLIKILDNLITFSFDQEKVLLKNSNSMFNSQELLKQKQLVSNFNIIKDSLYSLSAREESLNSVINKEIVNIQMNFNTIEKLIQDSYVSSLRLNQQNILTSANNLALFISEVIKQLQQQMANSMPGNQNCQKPGNNPNPNSMGNSLKSMQQGLQQQLEKMMQMMKEGKSGKAYNSELGKALSQQEKMQELMQKMMNQGNVGSSSYETLKDAEQLLNKVKEDLLRNNISNQTLNREKQILTRLLEAENAENERGLEEKRKSSTATKPRISESAKYFDNKDSIDFFEERILKKKLIFNSFYQNKFQNYIISLDSLNEKTN